MWLKTETMISPRLSSVEPGHLMLGAEEEKESNVTGKKGTRDTYKNVITYFHEITRIHVCGDKHLPSITTAQAGRRWMEGEETEDRAVKSVQSQVGVPCPCEQTRVKPRPVPPPQGPGGRCRGTDGQCPSNSGA